MALFIYVMTGLLAGILSGLLGIGGGIIVVPSLFLTFYYLGFSVEYAMQVSIGTSLGAMVLTSFSSAVSHYLKRGIVWAYFYSLTPGILIGSILGARAADILPSRILGIFFGMCLVLIGFYFLFFKKIEQEDKAPKNSRPFLLSLLGIGIGTLSALLGIGGGIITVPLLSYYKVPLRKAISTSAAVGFIIALFGALSFLAFGMGKDPCKECLGYLYLPAFITIGLSAALTAPFGARIAYILPTLFIQHIFGFVLISAGFWIFFINQRL